MLRRIINTLDLNQLWLIIRTHIIIIIIIIVSIIIIIIIIIIILM